MVIAGIEVAETGGTIANLMFSLTLIFCGYAYLQPPFSLPLHDKLILNPASSQPPKPSPASGSSCTASPPSPT
jgi:hypothetical protein